MGATARRIFGILILRIALVVPPAARGIEVGSTVSCSLANREYLDISSLECIQCDDDRYVPRSSSVRLYTLLVSCRNFSCW